MLLLITGAIVEYALLINARIKPLDFLRRSGKGAAMQPGCVKTRHALRRQIGRTRTGKIFPPGPVTLPETYTGHDEVRENGTSSITK